MANPSRQQLSCIGLPSERGSGSFNKVMSQRLCARCRHAVSFDDESSLVFCGHCGAPQVTISEDLLEQTRVATISASGIPEDETEEQRAARLASQPPDMLVVWRSAIRIVLLVAAAIALLSVALPIEILAWLAPGIVIGIYAVRHRETLITTAFGVRLGLVCGILCAFGITLVKTVQMLFLRYALHQGANLDAGLQQTILQARTNAVAQSGEAAAATIFNPLLYQPEFRVGFYLFALLLGTIVFIALSTLSGAFSGYMRSRRTLR
jgi:hypothetical protein